MKYLILLLTLICCVKTTHAQLGVVLVSFNGNYFYHQKGDENSKLIIFLHGGVSNPSFSDSAQIPDLAYLMEDNTAFLETARLNEFDVLIPIKNKQFNWLSEPDYCFQVLTAYLASIDAYKTRIISGFSDGGTGSYKLFYQNNAYFDGLAVFNGYPQHNNAYKQVNYKAIVDKPVLFFSTFDDQTIPYEFLLTEYCKQKQSNANTYLYVKAGEHTFKEYGLNEMRLLFNVLTSKISNTKKDPVHALIKNDQVIQFYPYRKKIYKKYGYGKDYYQENKMQQKLYGK